MVDYHNDWHGGSGFSVTQLIRLALDLEAQWKVKCDRDRKTSRDAGYDGEYNEFVLSTCGGRITKWKHYDCAKSFSHRLSKFGIHEQAMKFLDAETDYLNPLLQTTSLISVLHHIVTQRKRKPCMASRVVAC